MSRVQHDRDEECGGGRTFQATHWSVVLAAGHEDSARRAEALEILCRTYWEPIYVYLRRQGYGVPDAQDLTQAFFLRLLTHNAFANAEPQKGKFRSFLLASLQHFLADERDRACAAKRGGGQPTLPLDQGTAERHYLEQADSDLSPEKAFDHRWALTLLDHAFTKLQEESTANGATEHFNLLKPFLSRKPSPGEYEAVGEELGMTADAVAVRVHRLRQRYRDLLRGEIAHTVNGLADLEDEMRYVIGLICR